MGFYGNITNTSNTSFSYDRTYANRAEMDQNAAIDGVLVGRYVLVEYDAEDKQFPELQNPVEIEYEGATTFIFQYPDENKELKTIIQPTDKYRNDNDYTVFFENEIGKFDNKYYRCIGYKLNDTDIFDAIFVQIATTYDDNNNLITITDTYERNHKIDQLIYGSGSSLFDSTMWVKQVNTVGDSGQVKYVKIADINGIVPTFTLEADAPTTAPIAPHFDTIDKTNIHYSMHVQTPWGFRVASAESDSLSDEKVLQLTEDFGSDYKASKVWNPNAINEENQWVIYHQIKTTEIKDDERSYRETIYQCIPLYCLKKTDKGFEFIDIDSEKELDTYTYAGVRYYLDNYQIQYYDKLNEKLENNSQFRDWNGNNGTFPPITELIPNEPKLKTVYGYNADIYYNAAGFNPKEKNVVEKDNVISITPTGVSGALYNTHNPSNPGEDAALPDIQELHINLPVIGNTISKVWDIVHGENRDDWQGDAYRLYDSLQEEDKEFFEKCIDTESQYNGYAGTYDEEGNFIPARFDSLQGRLNSFNELLPDSFPFKRTEDGKLIGAELNGGGHSIDTTSYDGDEDDQWIETTLIPTTKELGDETEKEIIAFGIHHKSPVDLKDENYISNISDYQQKPLSINYINVDTAGHITQIKKEIVTILDCGTGNNNL